MSETPRVVYRPKPDAAPEGELAALADVYSFVLRCAEEKKKGGPDTAPDDAKEEIKSAFRADSRLP